MKTWRALSAILERTYILSEKKAAAKRLLNLAPRSSADAQADRRSFNRKARNRVLARTQAASRRANRRAA